MLHPGRRFNALGRTSPDPQITDFDKRAAAHDLGHVERRSHTNYLIGGKRCTPEDCGGPHGYANLLESLADPNHPEHDERIEWIGPHFASERFDLNGVNKELRALGARWRPRAASLRRTRQPTSTKRAND